MMKIDIINQHRFDVDSIIISDWDFYISSLTLYYYIILIKKYIRQTIFMTQPDYVFFF